MAEMDFICIVVRRGDKTHTTNATIILITFVCAIKKNPRSLLTASQQQRSEGKNHWFQLLSVYNIHFLLGLFLLSALDSPSHNSVVIVGEQQWDVQHKTTTEERWVTELSRRRRKKVKQHHNVVDDDEIRTWMEGARGRHIIKVESLLSYS